MRRSFNTARSGAGGFCNFSGPPPSGVSVRLPIRGSFAGSTSSTSRRVLAGGFRRSSGRTTPRTCPSTARPPGGVATAARPASTWCPPTPRTSKRFWPNSGSDAKTNEHKAALELLGVLAVKDKIITGDAMFTQRDSCAKVIEGGGDYVLPVKENQPTLGKDIAAAFAEPEAGLSPLQAARREAEVDRDCEIDRGTAGSRSARSRSR